MTKRNAIFVSLLGIVLLCGGVVLAQKPAQNVSGKRHPNLAAAQRLSEQAYQKIVAAQGSNKWDMNGHAQKAKELLDQVNSELKQAAEPQKTPLIWPEFEHSSHSENLLGIPVGGFVVR